MLVENGLASMAEILTGKAESKKEYSVNISDAKSSEAILKIVAA